MDNFLNVSRLCFAEDNFTLLKNINFSITGGQIVCLLGNNGSGKSTLLRLCAGLLKPSYGDIFLNDLDIFKLQDEERAKLIAWLPQNLSRPYSMTQSEFMDLTQLPVSSCMSSRGLPTSSPCLTGGSNLEKFLELFEVERFKYKQISTLSGGEWKRTQLARLWQTNCRFMLLDEPDGDLDLRHKKKLSRLCKQYVHQNNTIMLIVTHDIVFAREVADKIFALADGHLVWNSHQSEFWNSKIINKIFTTKVF